MKTITDSLTLDLANCEASEYFAKALAAFLPLSLVMTFSGEIGTGKTTLVRALLRALGVVGAIKSPTFSLIETYTSALRLIHHFDLYRIHEPSELDYLGFREYFVEPALCCIEWPEHAKGALPKVDLRFTLTLKGSGRQMQIQATTEAGRAVLCSFQEKI
jgi:tRNA threonylcarbamoyladenosine biosynthesis protein TsaE